MGRGHGPFFSLLCEVAKKGYEWGDSDTVDTLFFPAAPATASVSLVQEKGYFFFLHNLLGGGHAYQKYTKRGSFKS